VLAFLTLPSLNEQQQQQQQQQQQNLAHTLCGYFFFMQYLSAIARLG